MTAEHRLTLEDEDALLRLLDYRATLGEVEKQAKEEKDKVNLQLLDLTNRLGTGFVVGEWKVSPVKGRAPQKTIDGALLLKAGVSPAVIASATKLGKEGEPGVRVSRVKGEKEGEAQSGNGEPEKE